MNIIGCEYKCNYLVDIQSGSTLEMNNGLIENNTGRQPIIHVAINGTLNLNGVIFRKNVQHAKNVPSCIKAGHKGTVNIVKCKFLDHSSEKYPDSINLINTNGNLNIESSVFTNNKIEKGNIRTIKVRFNIANLFA